MGTVLSSGKKGERLYDIISQELADQIRAGRFPAGGKIPGTRLLAESFDVSVNTILHVQKILENQGMIEAVPRSGFYVKWQPGDTKALELGRETARLKPTLMQRQQLTLDLIHASGCTDVLPLGTAMPHHSFFPTQELQRISARIVRNRDSGFGLYEAPSGLVSLKESLAQRMLGFGCRTSRTDILITNGCHEALLLALQCVTEHGDVVLVESPGYLGLLQIIDILGLRAIALPSQPQTGISLNSIRRVCEKWPVKACVLVSNFGSPHGSFPDDQHKQDLLALLKEFDVPLVEDDIFSDLSFSGARPPPYKKFDTQGEVLYCNSFSKTVAPGLRVGWLSPGRYAEKAAYLKFSQNIATPRFNQRVLDEYLRNGGIDKHIRKVRRIYTTNVGKTIELISDVFPAGTVTAQPQGGFMLWVKLPESFNTARLYQQALAENIFVAPGKLFSTDRHIQHFLRINCALPWEEILKPAIIQLARLLGKKP